MYLVVFIVCVKSCQAMAAPNFDAEILQTHASAATAGRTTTAEEYLCSHVLSLNRVIGEDEDGVAGLARVQNTLSYLTR